MRILFFLHAVMIACVFTQQFSVLALWRMLKHEVLAEAGWKGGEGKKGWAAKEVSVGADVKEGVGSRVREERGRRWIATS